MTGLIVALIALATIVVLSLTTDILEIFAPVVNSGSMVVACAFVAGVIIYRMIRYRRGRRGD